MWDVEMLRLPAVVLRLLRRSRVAAVYRTEESAPIGCLCPSRRLLFARGLLFVSALYRSFGRGGRVLYLRTRMYVCMYGRTDCVLGYTKGMRQETWGWDRLSTV